ncbi:KamA family radical SAM protein [Candidatus Similichlamydia epinepheli]|uniref:KamA family radical SAM protein n=1 Tax=Candidatus Similichlamydia epinepheli TaxID=1903953 RepID=UPI000D34D072|nr:KamA family radical SAM protein [Candidatus Similichlamydia epinepheli]
MSSIDNLNCDQHILWKEIQKQNIRTLGALSSLPNLSSAQLELFEQNERFPCNIPVRLAHKIEQGNLNDPILLQFLPTKEESFYSSGFSDDPLQEKNFLKTPRLLQKYHGRALLLLTGACAMHCRYCFRSQFEYANFSYNFSKEIEIIRQNRSIEEIIFSGGDPLSLSENSLKKVLDQIASVPHIRRIRFHTRFPVGIPERINECFLNLISSFQNRFQFWFFLHINHKNELGDDLFQSILGIQKLGIPVGTQTVLLKGVNDSTESLSSLFTQVIDRGIFPYYLFQLDRVSGSSRFEVSIDKGLKIMEEIKKLLPGYAIPRYVQEVPNRPYKEALTANSLVLHAIDQIDP